MLFDNNSNKSERNLGVSCLKVIMCFMVIVCHCWNAERVYGIWKFVAWLRNYAVCAFMFLAFFFSYNIFSNNGKIKKRIGRLVIPQFGWAVIYWCSYQIMDMIFHNNMQHGIEDFWWQFFTGNSPRLNPSMWFQFDIIVVTLLLYLVCRLFNKKVNVLLLILLLFNVIIQYTNAVTFVNGFRYELKYTIGRLPEMMPLAIIGFWCGRYHIIERLETIINRILIIIASIIGILFIYFSNIFFTDNGYGYSGADKIIVAFLFVTLFYYIPLKKISSGHKRVIDFLTSFTLGIYCMHRLTSTILNGILHILKYDNIFSSFEKCIIIYIMSFIACYFAGLIVKNSIFKNMIN